MLSAENPDTWGEQRVDVAVPAEHTAVAQQRGSQDKPGGFRLQEPELPFESGVGQALDLWYPFPDEIEYNQAPTPPTSRKVSRHESSVLSEVPSGTPKRLAMVMPAIIIDTASDPLPLSANFSATIEETPK